MTQSKGELRKIEGWEILVSVPAYLLFLYVFLERHEIFTDAVRDFSRDSAFLVLCWAPGALLFLLLGRPWLRRSEFGSQIRFAGIVFCQLAFLLLFTAVYPPYRYKLFRAEVLYLPLGIAVSEREAEDDLPRYLLNRRSGPYILKDPKLMRVLAGKYGWTLIGHDPTAVLLWRALKHQGVDVTQLFKEEGHEGFFLACWLAQSRNAYELEPDFLFDWTVPLTESGHDDWLGPGEIESLKERLLSEPEKIEISGIQALLGLLGRETGQFSPEEIERILSAWSEAMQEQLGSIPGALEQLESGLAHRDRIRDFIGEAKELKVSMRINEQNRSSYTESLPLSATVLESGISLLLGTLGCQAEFVPWEEADLSYTVRLAQPFETTLSFQGQSTTFTHPSVYWLVGGKGTERVWPLGLEESFLLRKSDVKRFGY